MSDIRILRLPEVIKKTGLSRSSIYEFSNVRKFPASVQIGPRAKGWLESEIDEWIKNRSARSF